MSSLTPIVILDTNIVLDLFLFSDPRTTLLLEQLQFGQLIWQATPHMRNELERVLTYAHIKAKLALYKKFAADILQAFDESAKLTQAPTTKAPYTCKDPDDQAFIDLACHLAAQANTASPCADLTKARKIHLISKDKAVTSMRKRLEKLSVIVTTTHMA